MERLKPDEASPRGVVSLQRSLSYHDFIPRKPSGPGLPAYKPMFDKLFGKKRADSAKGVTSTQRMRATSGSSMAEMAAEMLAAPTALAQLTQQVGRLPLTDMLSEVQFIAERHLVSRALEVADGHVERAARALGLTVDGLELRMRRHRLSAAGHASDKPLLN